MFDIHIHSCCSDGSETPERIAQLAKDAGASLFALTDHDCVSGVERAQRRATELGIDMLPGAELEAEYPQQLHLICVGMDIHAPEFEALLEKQRRIRDARNLELAERLKRLGMDVSQRLDLSAECITRAHFAAELVRAGHAQSVSDAFRTILGRGCPGYVPQKHPEPGFIIETVAKSGGVCILAHPMKMNCCHSRLIAQLKQDGLWGVEAYYSSATPGQTQQFVSLARSFGLMVTCGSDFHGVTRPAASICGAWHRCPELELTQELLAGMAAANRARNNIKGAYTAAP